MRYIFIFLTLSGCETVKFAADLAIGLALRP